MPGPTPGGDDLTTVAISRRGWAESERLTRALITIASNGLRPHCSDPGTSELWLSDHPGERREAVKLCRGCPVFAPCGAAADERDERHGVWGGVDRTITPGRANAPSSKSAPTSASRFKPTKRAAVTSDT